MFHFPLDRTVKFIRVRFMREMRYENFKQEIPHEELKEMKLTSEQKKKQYRKIYESMFSSPFIPITDISEVLGVEWRPASKRLEEAKKLQIIMGPVARPLSFFNLREYVYVFNAENPDAAYDEYCSDPRVLYNARIAGYYNTLVFSSEKIDIGGDIKVQGPRSDFHVSFAPDQSFDQALLNGLKKIEAFSPDSYSPRKYIKNHSDETVKWDENDEKLYSYFKYDLRKKVGPLIKEQQISKDIIYHFLETIEKRCTIVTAYFPESYLNHVSYLYTFNTDYEDFIIEVFSELPTTTISFKVADTLFLYVYAPRKFIWDVDPYTPKGLRIPHIEKELFDKQVVRNKARSIIEYSWSKTF